MTKQTELPEGDFFSFNQRSDAIYPRGDYDPDPEETRAIRTRREELCKELGIPWPKPDVGCNDLFTGRPAEMPPLRRDMVHRRIAFKRPAPKNRLYHYFQSGCQDYATGQGGHHAAYRVVSDKWKAAVEDIEPGIHQFFDYDLCFTDKIISCFIFQPRTVVEMRSDKNQHITAAKQPYKLLLKKTAFVGKHWTSQLHYGWQFASRQLAERLLPLLPPETSFVPQWAEK